MCSSSAQLAFCTLVKQWLQEDVGNEMVNHLIYRECLPLNASVYFVRKKPLSLCISLILVYLPYPCVSPLSLCISLILVYLPYPCVSPLSLCISLILVYLPYPCVSSLSLCISLILVCLPYPCVSPLSLCFSLILVYLRCVRRR